LLKKNTEDRGSWPGAAAWKVRGGWFSPMSGRMQKYGGRGGDWGGGPVFGVVVSWQPQIITEKYVVTI